MRILIDSHIFLWLVTNDGRLSTALKSSLSDAANTTFLSVVSLWEITIKHDLGKLPLPNAPNLYIPDMRRKHLVQNLDLDEPTVQRLPSLPAIHKDPFDRMLICQALEHGMTIATVDDKIRSYPIPTI